MSVNSSKDAKLALKIAEQLRLRDVRALLASVDQKHLSPGTEIPDFCLWVLLNQLVDMNKSLAKDLSTCQCEQCWVAIVSVHECSNSVMADSFVLRAGGGCQLT